MMRPGTVLRTTASAARVAVAIAATSASSSASVLGSRSVLSKLLLRQAAPQAAAAHAITYVIPHVDALSSERLRPGRRPRELPGGTHAPAKVRTVSLASAVRRTRTRTRNGPAGAASPRPGRSIFVAALSAAAALGTPVPAPPRADARGGVPVR